MILLALDFFASRCYGTVLGCELGEEFGEVVGIGVALRASGEDDGDGVGCGSGSVGILDITSSG